MPKRRSRLTNCYVPLIWPGDGGAYRSSRKSSHSNNRSVVDPLEVVDTDDDGENTTQPQQKQHQQRTQDNRNNKEHVKEKETQQRGPLSLRPLLLQKFNPTTTSGTTCTSTACAYAELGRTKVLCHVQAPIPSHQVPSHLVPLPTDQGILYCQVKYTPHLSYSPSQVAASSVHPLHEMGNGGSSSSSSSSSMPILGGGIAPQQQQRHISTWMEVRESQTSRSLQAALTAALALEQFPHTALGVFVTVIQDDGGALELAIMAASLALTQAQVPLWDIVVAARVVICRVGCKDDSMGEHKKSNQDQSNAREGKVHVDHQSENLRKDETIEDMEENENQFTIWLDPSEEELLRDPRIVTTLRMAWMPNRKMVTLWEQQQHYPVRSHKTSTDFSTVPPATITDKAMQACRQACTKILHPRLRQCLVEQQQQQSPDQAGSILEERNDA